MKQDKSFRTQLGTACSGGAPFLRSSCRRSFPSCKCTKAPAGNFATYTPHYRGNDYLLAHKSLRRGSQDIYLIAAHDVAFIVDYVLPKLFASEEGKRQYNVVDQDNRRVFGPNLAMAGDYVVGKRFPTTLYSWRLQIAPKEAPLLHAQQRSQFVTEASLVGLSFLILLLGLAVMLYATLQETRLNALRSEFVANVSHELKTPLSVIRMFSEYAACLDRVRREDKRTQYLEIIGRESERLSALIENVLDFSAIERGKQKYNLRTGNLTAVVQGAIDTFLSRADREHFEVNLERESAALNLEFDEQAILLAVINLLDNAAKYGRPPVQVQLEEGKRHVYVRVSDRGDGIPQEYEKRVFDRFFRVKARGQTRGSGIGLSIVRRIAEAHGGHAHGFDQGQDGGAVVCFSIAKTGLGPQRAAPDNGAMSSANLMDSTARQEPTVTH